MLFNDIKSDPIWQVTQRQICPPATALIKQMTFDPLFIGRGPSPSHMLPTLRTSFVVHLSSPTEGQNAIWPDQRMMILKSQWNGCPEIRNRDEADYSTALACLSTPVPCFNFGGGGRTKPSHGFDARISKYIQVPGF